MCVRKSADVLQYSVPQLIDCPHISRILIADGPHVGCGNGITRDALGPHCEEPTVEKYIKGLKCDKIVYEYTDHLPNRAQKNNRILKQTSKDCKWILCVDSDEVYHENDLIKLYHFLKNNPPYGRYRIYTVDLFPDFHHYLRLGDSKCRLYFYEKGYACKPSDDRAHQFVDGKNQKKCEGSWRSMAFLDPAICRLFHLNTLRTKRRLIINKNGDLTYKPGGKQRATSSVYPFNIKDTPKSLRESGLDTIINLDNFDWSKIPLNYVK